MVRVPVVSVLQDGVVESFVFQLEELGPKSAEIELQGVTFDEALFQQLYIAKSTAESFLSQPYVCPLAVNSLKKAKLIVSSPKGGDYEGTSFGLPFLIGCLAAGLGVPVREGKLFSAGLIESSENLPGAAVAVHLGPVAGIGAKLSAACIEHHSCLYLRPDSEDQMLEFEQGFWRGQADRNCLPYTLPEWLSIASVIAISLEPEELLTKAISNEYGAAFVLLMYVTARELHNGASLMKGIGSALAKLRYEGRLDNVMFFRDLIQYFGRRDTDSAEELLLLASKGCLEKCVTDSQRAEVIKGIISQNPGLPLFSEVKKVNFDDGRALQGDLDIWLDHVKCHNLLEFQRILTVLRTCSQLANDFEGYWSKIEKLITGILSAFFDKIIESFQLSNLNLVGSQLYTFIQLNIIDCIGRLRPGLVRRIKGIIAPCLKQIQKSDNKQISDTAAFLDEQLIIYQLPEALIEIEQEEKPVLELTFSLTDTSKHVKFDSSGAILPRPPLGKINDLQLLISGPEKLSLLVPSPVLLFENCYRHHSSFCKRRDFRLVDDTMSHYPENDAILVGELFDNSHCNIIGFWTNHDNQKGLASIRWRSNLNPWPPAIDSQFLAASIVESNTDYHFRRLLDIGCGSGYLSIVGAHHWPSLEELHLVDVDVLSTAAAQVNIQQDPITKKLAIQTYWRGFEKFQGHGFDILLCAPPYLPDRPWPDSRIEVATNGTELLEQVVLRAGNISKETWMVFSTFAWPEFQRALAQVPNTYKLIEILRREFVPFRISWLEPRPPGENGNPNDYLSRRQYYEKVLMKRGLIDFDEMNNWPKYLQDFALTIPDNCSTRVNVPHNVHEIEEKLDAIKQDSRGYRFWHEVRVVRLVSA